ncbi:hypothetical protein ACFQQB_19765 [Nonomuraea rubra]|uniref:hypothetical protein n=1 Tax=Nonomuraea rubra TaxID=46180 RepID=UPI0036201EA9
MSSSMRRLLAVATVPLLVLSAPGVSTARADPDWSIVPEGSAQPSAKPTAQPTRDTGHLPWQKALPGPARVVRERRLDARTLDILISSPSVGRMLPVRLLLPRAGRRARDVRGRCCTCCTAARTTTPRGPA